MQIMDKKPFFELRIYTQGLTDGLPSWAIRVGRLVLRLNRQLSYTGLSFEIGSPAYRCMGGLSYQEYESHLERLREIRWKKERLNAKSRTS